MAIYLFKRYRRSAPGRDNGTVTDELRFSASSTLEAETRIRRGGLLPLLAPMDWENYFATLEDADGHVLARWLHGWLHA